MKKTNLLVGVAIAALLSSSVAYAVSNPGASASGTVAVDPQQTVVPEKSEAPVADSSSSASQPKAVIEESSVEIHSPGGGDVTIPFVTTLPDASDVAVKAPPIPDTDKAAKATAKAQTSSIDGSQAPHDDEGPYAEALQCVNDSLTPAQHQQGWSAEDIIDQTGQVNSIADAGTGSFSTQASVSIMTTSLTKAGVLVIDNGLDQQHDTDYGLSKAAAGFVGDGNTYELNDSKKGKKPLELTDIPPWQGTVVMPHYIVRGSISTLDFIPGGGIDLQIVLNGEHLKSAMRVSMDMRVVQQAYGPQLGNAVVATERVKRQVVALQNSIGLSSLFRSANYYSFTIGKDQRQALQDAETAMIDRFAAVLVAKVYHVTRCNQYVAYGDTLAFGTW